MQTAYQAGIRQFPISASNKTWQGATVVNRAFLRHTSIAGGRNVMGVFFTLIGLAGYILPLPSLIWGWVGWFRSKPRFAPPAWRCIAVLLGLTLASVIGLSVLTVAYHSNGLPEGATKYSFAIAASRLGLAASAIALVLSLVGKGPVRLPASLASLDLAALWVFAALTY
jgi:hypothetical protein